MNEQVVVRSVRTGDLDAATRVSIVDVCIAAHGVEEFRHLFDWLPPDGLHLLAFDAAHLVGHAVVTTRWLQPAGQPTLPTGFVDAVATVPARQREGIGGAVMRQAVADLDGEFAIGCLQTDREPFYRALGWETWRGPLAGRRGDELVPTPGQSGVMVFRLPSTPPLDLDALLTIECQPNRIWE